MQGVFGIFPFTFDLGISEGCVVILLKNFDCFVNRLWEAIQGSRILGNTETDKLKSCVVQKVLKTRKKNIIK